MVYEFELRGELVKDIKTVYLNTPNINVKDDGKKHHYRWHFPQTEAEIAALNKAYGLSIPIEYTNQWVCVEYTDYDLTASYTLLSWGMNYVKSLLDVLGYKIEIKEK